MSYAVYTQISLSYCWDKVEPNVIEILRTLPRSDRFRVIRIVHGIVEQCSRNASFAMLEQFDVDPPPSYSYAVSRQFVDDLIKRSRKRKGGRPTKWPTERLYELYKHFRSTGLNRTDYITVHKSKRGGLTDGTLNKAIDKFEKPFY